MSRVWLGVHWRFDAFSARETLVSSSDSSAEAAPANKASEEQEPLQASSRDQNGPPYHVDADGSARYKPHTTVQYRDRGTRQDRRDAGKVFPIGGVPLGIGIASAHFSLGFAADPGREAAQREEAGR